MKKNDLMEYKEYCGSIHFDADNELFYGKVEFIRDLISYEATDAKSLINAFKGAIDEYLDDCKLLQKTPDIPFKGTFNVRVSPDLHRDISLYAIRHHDTLNGVIKKALHHFLASNIHA